MRKALVLFLALLVLVGGGFIAAHAAVNSQKEQVTWQEQTIYGDKSVVEGLTVTTQNSYDNSLLWNTTGVLGQTLDPKTDFYFSNQNHSSPYPVSYQGVNISVGYGLYALEDAVWMNEYTREQMAGMLDFYKNCVEATPEGTERTFTLDVTEYLDYYPLEGWFDLPGYGSANWCETNQNDPALMEAARTMNEYFKIPILGTYQVELTIDKIYDGVSSSSGMPMDYSPDFSGVVAGNTCFFTFSAVASEGVYADCSQIPGGYGIYSFTYSQDENGQSTVDLDSLSTVYPLDPSEMYLGMSLSADERRLLLQTRDADQFYLTVIDIATMTCLQKIELIDEPEQAYTGLRIEDDFIAIFCSDYQANHPNTITLFAAQTDGTYRHAFTVKQGNESFDLWEVLEYRGYDMCQLAYNGEYLVVAQNAAIMEEDRYRADTCDFYIVAYGPEGMAYAGQYHVSLTDVNNSNLAFPCDPFGNYPLRIFWEE